MCRSCDAAHITVKFDVCRDRRTNAVRFHRILTHSSIQSVTNSLLCLTIHSVTLLLIQTLLILPKQMVSNSKNKKN